MTLLFRNFLTGNEETHGKPNQYNQVPAYILISQILSTNKIFITNQTVHFEVNNWLYNHSN
jgi:hypothetical protein